MANFRRLILIFWFVFIPLAHAEQRIQISPHSPVNLDHRYNLIKSSNPFDLLTRPFPLGISYGETWLNVQLQPTYYRTGSNSELYLNSWINLNIAHNLHLVNEMQIYYADQNQVGYVGDEWRSLSGSTNQSYLRWESESTEFQHGLVQVGRFYYQTGPGRTGQLLSGSKARPLDQILFSYGLDFNHVALQFQFQTAALDKASGKSRYLTKHRLQLLFPNAYLAISEALLYSKVSGGMEPVYLNPFIFYHMEQLNGPDLSGNTLGTIEMGFLYKHSHLYMEFLVDDIQLDNEVVGDLEPNELGIIVGVEHSAPKLYLGLEGVAITNRTYKTSDPSEWYLHRNVPIGYELGSDLGRINFTSRYYLEHNYSLNTKIDMIWQGEGSLDQPWDTPWNSDSVTMETGYSESFPTGIIEQTNELQFGILKHWTNERWLSLDFGVRAVQNIDHQADTHSDEYFINLAGSWTIGHHFQF